MNAEDESIRDYWEHTPAGYKVVCVSSTTVLYRATSASTQAIVPSHVRSTSLLALLTSTGAVPVIYKINIKRYFLVMIPFCNNLINTIPRIDRIDCNQCVGSDQRQSEPTHWQHSMQMICKAVRLLISKHFSSCLWCFCGDEIYCSLFMMSPETIDNMYIYSLWWRKK